MTKTPRGAGYPPSRGGFANTGAGRPLIPIDIKHQDYLALIDPDSAFWALLRKESFNAEMAKGDLFRAYQQKSAAFLHEMEGLRFGLKPSTVYFNTTERCNLNCTYCYIPVKTRKNGRHMSEAELMKSLTLFKAYFKGVMPKGRLPQIIFHGAEPLLTKDIILTAIEHFRRDFRFGLQTNGTLLDETTATRLRELDVGIGLSLDGPTPHTADKTRIRWSGKGVFGDVMRAIDLLEGYEGFNIICTVTSENMKQLPQMVRFFHKHKIPAAMLNMLRCTLPRSRDLKPLDHVVWPYFEAALNESHRLYAATGRKLVIANFANILISILAPTARRLLCDISPCGGGRAFFAVTPGGDAFPCSEFIGIPAYRGGNIFKDPIHKIMESAPFQKVTKRVVEKIDPCSRCAIRHFCGSPCPAEADQMHGGMDKTGAFCEFYEEQVRYAFRLIADGKADDFLWDQWDRHTKTTFALER